MRQIKFRGKDIETDKWVDGDLIQRMGYMPSIMFPYESNGKVRYGECAVKRETVGQFTGLLDKNGKDIYEGDIIRYTDIDSFVVNPDCDLALQFCQTYAKIQEDVVEFNNGAFVLSDEIYHRTISSCGFNNINDILECVDGIDGGFSDCNGTVINESLLGIEVIGNIHDNPELLKGGAE